MLWAHWQPRGAFTQGFKADTVARDPKPGGFADRAHDDAEYFGAVDIQPRRQSEADLDQHAAEREHRRGRVNCEIASGCGVAPDQFGAKDAATL
jgi:hypothetical protein